MKTRDKIVEQSSEPNFDNVVLQTWGQYISFNHKNPFTSQNLEFIRNPTWDMLQNYNYNKTIADKHGLLNVPSKFSFWMILY